MRTMIQRLVIERGSAFLIGLLLSMAWVSTAAAHVTLFPPVGGGTFMVGETVKVEWGLDISHGPSNWDLYFSPDGGATWQVIQLNISKFQFSYDWLVPGDSHKAESGLFKTTRPALIISR